MSDVNVHGSMTFPSDGYARPTVPDLPTIPSSVHKSLTIIPIKKVSKDSPQIMSQDKKEMKPKWFPSKLPCVSSSSKIPNDVHIIPINNKEDNVISLLKKLPDISFDVIKSESAYKVPDIPEIKKKSHMNSLKKVPFQSQYNDIIGLTGTDFYDKNTLKRKQKPVVIDNIQLLKNINIQKNKNKTKIVSNKMSLPIKENILITPNKFSKKPKILSNTKLNDLTNIHSVKQNSNFSTVFHGKKQSSYNSFLNKTEIITNESLNKDTMLTNVLIKAQKSIVPASCSTNLKDESNDSKNIQSAKPNVNSVNESHDIKQNSDDSILNKTEIKTDESFNEHYTLTNISTNGQTNIVPALCSSYLIHENVSNNDNIVSGISKESEFNNTLFETTENYGKEVSSNFSDLLGFVKTSLEINNTII